MKQIKNDAKLKTRTKNKIFLVKHFGGKCEECGYDKCLSALTFHHLDPREKEYNIGQSAKPLKELIIEASKCRLLCRNCHAEEHAPEYHFNFKDIDISPKLKKINKCMMCDKDNYNNKFCSRECKENSVKTLIPTKKMIKLMKKHKSFVKVSEILGCSDKTVRDRMQKDCPNEVSIYKYKKLNQFIKCLNCKIKIKSKKEQQKYCSRNCYIEKVEMNYRKYINKIVGLQSNGLDNNQIAKKLKINLRTLDGYIQKYNLKNK